MRNYSILTFVFFINFSFSQKSKIRLAQFKYLKPKVYAYSIDNQLIVNFLFRLLRKFNEFMVVKEVKITSN